MAETDFSRLVQPGLSQEAQFQVTEDRTALHLGSGTARVLASPWMIAWMEHAARDLLGQVLPDGYSSVGVRVDVRHLAPTPVGSKVWVRVEVLHIQGNRVTLQVSARDEVEAIGEGTHERVIVDEARFLRRAAAKGPPEG